MGRGAACGRAALAAGALLCALAAWPQERVPPRSPELGQPGKDVMWLPTPQSLVERMLDVAALRAEDTVIDLGSGDGRMVIAAAKRGARALGIEYDPKLVVLAQKNAAAAGVAARTRFEEGDLFESDLSAATVITMFLGEDLNLRLRPRLLALAPGTRIVSNTFRLGDWAPDAEVAAGAECAAQYYCRGYFWIVPAAVAGRWRIGEATLLLRQQFQKIGGSLGATGTETVLADAVLAGATIRFTAGGRRYAGRVAGDVIEGTVDGVPWRATRIPG